MCGLREPQSISPTSWKLSASSRFQARKVERYSPKYALHRPILTGLPTWDSRWQIQDPGTPLSQKKKVCTVTIYIASYICMRRNKQLAWQVAFFLSAKRSLSLLLLSEKIIKKKKKTQLKWRREREQPHAPLHLYSAFVYIRGPLHKEIKFIHPYHLLVIFTYICTYFLTAFIWELR